MRLIAAIFVLLLTADGAAANEHALGLLRQWVSAVHEHEPGAEDETFRTLAQWSDADLAVLQPYVDSVMTLILDRSTGARRRRVIDPKDMQAIRELSTVIANVTTFRKRAVVLHTDLALVGAASDQLPTPTARRSRGLRQQQASRRILVRSDDGRLSGFEGATLHWELAMDILNTLSKERDPLVALWYRTVGAHFASEYRFGDALLHWERARSVAMADANVLYGEACLHETLAAPPVQEFVRRAMLPNQLIIEGVGSSRSHLGRAESLLQKALSVEPAFHEAQLRLARVKSQLARHSEALPLARGVIAGSQSRMIEFYAHLVAGDAAESLGEMNDARAHYQRAIGLFPRAQSARLGLSRVLRLGGDEKEAAETLMPALSPANHADDDDPWWVYYQGDAPNLPTLLEQVRNAATPAR